MTELGESPVRELLGVIAVAPTDGAEFVGTAPDWFGDRVFGGLVLAQGLHAGLQTVEVAQQPHSIHAYFLGAVRPGPVSLSVQALRDGRSFSTRHVTSTQDARTRLWMTASFHGSEEGDEYQASMPVGLPEPDSLPPAPDPPPPFDIRDIGPTEQRGDGTYRSTHRIWVRTVEPLGDDLVEHVCVAAFLSDMTGTSFRPHSLGEWGTHVDASLDHTVWFHQPFRVDEWLYADFTPVVSRGGRSTVRGEFFSREGVLCMSMAQELLIRPLEVEPTAPSWNRAL